MRQRVIGFLADLHTGSPYAPWPENFVIEPGFTIEPSDGQRTLNGYIKRAAEIFDKEKVDTVFLLGDMNDGGNRKEFARDRMTADLNQQVRASIMMLSPLCEGRKVYGVHGTGYHDSLDMKSEKYLIEELAKIGAGGRYWGPFKNAKVNGSVVNVSHGEGGALIYRATKSDRELLHALAGEAAGKIKDHVDLFARAHLHFYGYLDNGVNRYLAVPCFTDWIPYKFSLKLYGRQPDIGFVIAIFDGPGEITIKRYLFELPGIAQIAEEV